MSGDTVQAEILRQIGELRTEVAALSEKIDERDCQGHSAALVKLDRAVFGNGRPGLAARMNDAEGRINDATCRVSRVERKLDGDGTREHPGALAELHATMETVSDHHVALKGDRTEANPGMEADVRDLKKDNQRRNRIEAAVAVWIATSAAAGLLYAIRLLGELQALHQAILKGGP